MKNSVCLALAIVATACASITATTQNDTTAVVFDASCDFMCTMDEKPICGSDFVTYSNACMLAKAKCELASASTNAKSLVRLYDGPCDKCDKVACPRDNYPVCGSDFKTYANRCELLVAKCRRRDPSLKVLSFGVCPECSTHCTLDLRPVCGSDGVTYPNTCSFESTRCFKRDPEMKVVKTGKC